MVFFDETGIIYIVISKITQNITGNDTLSVLFIIILLMLLAFAFRIPIEFTALFVFPLLIGFGAQAGAGFMPVLAIGIIYLSVLLAKNFFFWR